MTDPRLRPRSIVAGQYLGIATLVLVSAGTGVAAAAVPPGRIALIGVVPLALGIYKGVAAVRARGKAEDADEASSTLA